MVTAREVSGAVRKAGNIKIFYIADVIEPGVFPNYGHSQICVSVPPHPVQFVPFLPFVLDPNTLAFACYKQTQNCRTGLCAAAPLVKCSGILGKTHLLAA